VEFKFRKWGWYATLFSGRLFKVKLLYFKKGHSCSMQRHFKRNELWCFLFGEGNLLTRFGNLSSNYQVISGSYEEVRCLVWHKYIAKQRTLVLEIQTGLCDESDIERVN
jgi:mannose-6-phosphate isomerase-like protein (cupin superfamily)